LTGAIPAGAQQLTWKYGWTFASYALTVRRSGSANPSTEWLEGGQTSAPFNLGAPSLLSSASTPRDDTSLWASTHIVPNGLDHMLFVLGIFLLSRRARTVLWQVSAFTVAHSISLALSMYGVINVAPKVVEPLIALSIAYVAIENIFTSELKSWRVALVFAFGLLHGLGFAGALQELGLPRAEFITALLAFKRRSRGGTTCSDRHSFPDGRMVLREPRVVPHPRGSPRVHDDRLHGGLLDHPTADSLKLTLETLRSSWE
jgi:hydrogenase/urease accessory protein HupE